MPLTPIEVNTAFKNGFLKTTLADLVSAEADRILVLTPLENLEIGQRALSVVPTDQEMVGSWQIGSVLLSAFKDSRVNLAVLERLPCQQTSRVSLLTAPVKWEKKVETSYGEKIQTMEMERNARVYVKPSSQEQQNTPLATLGNYVKMILRK